MENDQRIKAGKGKPRLTLVPRKILYEIARVREYSTNKYGDPESWKAVEIERYRDAAFRHFVSYLDDPQGRDEESGISHLAHLAANIAFLCEMESMGSIKEPVRHIGDLMTVKLKNGVTAQFALTEIEEGYCRFDSRDCIGTHAWNDTDSTIGGYPESNIKNYVDNELWDLLPEDLQKAIIPTSRKCLCFDKENKEKIVEFSTKLFLPAASEIFSVDNCYGDKELYEQMEYYKDAKNRIRMDAGNPEETDWYWTQSTSGGNSTHALLSGTSGSSGNNDASDACGVPLCFRIKQRSCDNLDIRWTCAAVIREEYDE